MKIRFWGVRGSIATPGKETAKFGGNTSCIEVQCGDKLLIFDGGTGLRLLGNHFAQTDLHQAYIFFSHFHWDHIQGFPFFMPVYNPKNSFVLFGENKLANTLEETLSGQMAQPNFPVALKQLPGRLTFEHTESNAQFTIGNDITIQTCPLNHPSGATSFKITYKNKVFVYASDHEHTDKLDERLVQHSENADVLVYDSTYTEEEYYGVTGQSKKGWGHSTWNEGVKVAKAAKAKKFVLFHHDPLHDDKFISSIEKKAKKAHKDSIAAHEGLEIKL